MNKANIITVLCLIIIFGFIAILLVFITDNNNINETTEFSDLQLLDDNSLFFTVSFNINKICEYVNDEQSEHLYNILDKEYLNNNDITIYNIIDKFYDKYVTTSFSATEIYVISKGKNYKFYVKGNLKNEVMDEIAGIKEEDFFIFNYDIEESIFSIEPITEETYLSSTTLKNIEFNNLIKNEYNTIEFVNITDENLASMYFNDFISTVFSDTETIYNKFYDSTKKKYFNTYEDFLKYVDENIAYFQNLKIDKYNVSDNTINYIDNYGNEYTFVINKIMNYKILFIKEEDIHTE